MTFSLQYHFEFCTHHDISKFKRFSIDEKKVGWVSIAAADLLPKELAKDFLATPDGVALNPCHSDFNTRSAALLRGAECLSAYYKKKLHKEFYPVIEKLGDEPLAQINRHAASWFGTLSFGVHVNGFVRKADGIYLWIGERAMDRPIDPGKLDNMIAGGLPIGISPKECVVKEAQEEAGFDAAIADKAQPRGALRYTGETKNGLRNDTVFLYDLELPEGVAPVNTDGEVAAFHLLRAEEVREIVRTTDRFKFNCNLVIVDFLDRNGLIPPTDPEYEAIQGWLKKLRTADQSPCRLDRAAKSLP